MQKRITISPLKEHPALKGKNAEEQSTEQDDLTSETSQLVEWEMNQIRFVQKIAKQVENHKFLSSFLHLAFRFYINKVLLYLINKDIVQNYLKDKQGHPKLLKMIKDTEADLCVKLERTLQQMKELKEPRENIPNFQEGLIAKYQDFSKFKMGYRNTIGRVYE